MTSFTPTLASLSLALAMVMAAGPSVAQPIVSQGSSSVSVETTSGSVRRTNNGLCMEPGHPLYDQQTIVATHTNMRLCIAAGGQRDGPRDTLADPILPAPSQEDGLLDDGASAMVPGGAMVPGMMGGLIPGVDPSLMGQTPEDVQPTEGLLSDSIASTSDQDIAPARPPRGIALTDVPSYSQAPALFRPPAEYIGRGPEAFLP